MRTIQSRYKPTEYIELFSGYVKDVKLIQTGHYSPNDLTREQYETWLTYRQIYLDPVERQIIERRQTGLPPTLDIPEKKSFGDSTAAVSDSVAYDLYKSLKKLIRIPQIKIPGDLTWDGKYLWITDLHEWTNIHQIDPRTGLISRSFKAPSKGYGLASDGTYLYFGGYPKTLYKIDPQTEKVIYAVHDLDFSIYGLVWDGKRLWASDCNSNLIYNFSHISGSVYESFETPGDLSIGLSWDNNILYSIDNETKEIYKIDPKTGKIMSFHSLGTVSEITGITYDGRNLWLNDLESHSIYQYRYNK